MTLEPPLTISEVAELLRCTVKRVRRIQRDVLPWIKPGQERLYTRAAVAHYLETGEPPKPKTKKRGRCTSSDARAVRLTGSSDSPIQTGAGESFKNRLEKWQKERRGSAHRKSLTATEQPTS